MKQKGMDGWMAMAYNTRTRAARETRFYVVFVVTAWFSVLMRGFVDGSDGQHYLFSENTMDGETLIKVLYFMYALYVLYL